jgi:dTDP-4-dehydrorhamnose reductase
MLGAALQEVVAQRALRCVAPGESEFDITDAQQVGRLVEEFSASLEPGERGVLVNAAAYTNVERAEDERDLAFLVNEHGAGTLARAAKAAGLAFVHVSTDFVFDGRKTGAYLETDEPNPVSVYGLSKLAGERAVLHAMPGALVVRTAWVFAPLGANFPLKILAAVRERGSLSVVTDEVGSPTYTLDLARAILELADREAEGIHHLAGSGSCSRYELALEVLRVAGVPGVAVEPVSSSAFTTKAARPANSVLDCSKAARVGVVMPPWDDALARCLARVEQGD